MLTRIQRQHENRSAYRGVKKTSKSDALARSFPILIFSLFIFPALSWAQVLKHDVGGLERDFYKAKEVCEVMGLKHNLVVTPKPPATMDCMGREVLISDFCQKITREKVGLLRGKVDPFSKKVVCEYAQSLSLSFRCSPGRQEYCASASKGCAKLKSVFAIDLQVDHSSILPDGADQRLNCYFSHSKKSQAVQKILPTLDLDP